MASYVSILVLLYSIAVTSAWMVYDEQHIVCGDQLSGTVPAGNFLWMIFYLSLPEENGLQNVVFTVNHTSCHPYMTQMSPNTTDGYNAVTYNESNQMVWNLDNLEPSFYTLSWGTVLVFSDLVWKLDVNCTDATPFPTTDPTQEPTTNPTIKPTKEPTLVPTNAPTRNLEPTMNPTVDPTSKPTSDPTMDPTPSPSAAPSESPSLSPTQFPTKTDEYDSFIEMEYEIIGLSDSELDFIGFSIWTFSQNLSDIIESGFDNDRYLEYRYIEVNVTAMNDEEVDDLIDLETDIQRLIAIKQNEPTLAVMSYTNCSIFYCSYIIGADTGVLTFNESAFEHFITMKLREYFDFMVFGVDAAGGSAVEFNVTHFGDEAMSFEVFGAPMSSESEKEYIYYGLMAFSGAICLIGFIAIIFEKVSQKLDISQWTAFLVLGLKFWDFASDISLCFELWTLNHLFDSDKRLTLVCAVGSAVFLIIPYLSNLRIAAQIKKYVKKNEAASTWCVQTSDNSLFSNHQLVSSPALN